VDEVRGAHFMIARQPTQRTQLRVRRHCPLYSKPAALAILARCFPA
jgi:hypothetical protein